MRIYLLRHGIAIDAADPESPDDPGRWLTEEGIDKTRRAAEGLAALGVRPSVICQSPYRRARETAQLAGEALGIEPRRFQTWKELVPECDPRVTLRKLSEYKDKDVMLVGHNPHLSLLLALAMGAVGEPVWLKKAGCACVELASPGEKPGKLVWLHDPKALRKVSRR